MVCSCKGALNVCCQPEILHHCVLKDTIWWEFDLPRVLPAVMSKRRLGRNHENYIEYCNIRRYQRKLGVLTPLEKHAEYMPAA